MKILPLVAAAALLPLAGCGTSASPTDTTPKPTPTVTAPQSTAPEPTTPAGPTACAAGQLAAIVKYDGSGAGSSFHKLVVSNAGKQSCTVPSDPAVLQFTKAGKPVGPASTSKATETGAIELGEHMGVAAGVRIGSTGPYDAADCKPVPVDGINVTVGGVALNVAYDGDACSGDVQLFDVEPFADSPQKQQ